MPHRNVIEGDAGLRDLLELGLAAAEIHGAATAEAAEATRAASTSLHAINVPVNCAQCLANNAVQKQAGVINT